MTKALVTQAVASLSVLLRAPSTIRDAIVSPPTYSSQPMTMATPDREAEAVPDERTHHHGAGQEPPRRESAGATGSTSSRRGIAVRTLAAA